MYLFVRSKNTETRYIHKKQTKQEQQRQQLRPTPLPGIDEKWIRTSKKKYFNTPTYCKRTSLLDEKEIKGWRGKEHV